jgi:exodeoxyribonuclease VII small subunit
LSSGDTAGGTADIESFEDVFKSLQETVARLEEGGLPLHAAVTTFEQGIELADRCAALLDAAELRVTRAVADDGASRDEPAF